MKRILNFLILLNVFILCSACFGTEQMSLSENNLNRADNNTPNSSYQLSLHTCFDIADRANKEIAVSLCDLSISQAAIAIAKAIPNPTYNMTYGFGPAWKYIIAGNNQQFGWNEEIQVAGKRTKKTDVAQANYFQTALNIQAVRFDVHNRVRKAYTELAIAHAYSELIKNQQKVYQELLRIAKNRFAAGKSPGSEVLQAKLGLTQLDIQVNQAASRLVQDSARLSFLLGESPCYQQIIEVEGSGLYELLSACTEITPGLDRQIPSLEQLLPAAWRERNDLKAAIQQAYANRKAVTLAKAQRIPNPFLGFDYLFSTYTPFQQNYFTPQPGARTVPYQPGYLLTAAVETPIFNQYQGQINLAKATWDQQLKANDQLRGQIATDVVVAYEYLLLQIENMTKFRNELIPTALKAAKLSRRSYELGKTDLATAILAQQQYGQLVSSYFDSAIAYQNAWADLEKGIGLPLKMQ